MDRIAQKDWIKAYDKRNNSHSHVRAVALDGDGEVAVRVDSTLYPYMFQALDVSVSPAEAFADGRPASFAIEEDGTVSLLLGEGERPKFVPSVPNEELLPERQVVVPFAKWLADYKAVMLHKERRGREYEEEWKTLAKEGVRIGGDGRVVAVGMVMKGECDERREAFVGLQDILYWCYGLELLDHFVRWGDIGEDDRLTAYFNESLDVAFDADGSRFVYEERLDGGYFRKHGGHPVVSF